MSAQSRFPDYICAAHWFGEGWALDLWNSFSARQVARDFAALKEAGFNTIILVVPWGEFQPVISPAPTYNETAFDRFGLVLRAAQDCGLKVLLRISFRWDLHPDAQWPGDARFLRLFSDAQAHRAWLEYIGRLGAVAAEFENILFAFLSWEDFWGLAELAKAPHEQRLALAQETGFSAWLAASKTLAELCAAYGDRFPSFEAIPLPRANRPGYELLLQYFDEAFLGKLFHPAKTAFGNLSAEARSDWDPIYHADGTVRWVDHKDTFDLPDTQYVTTHYAACMGAENNGKPLPLDIAATLLDKKLAELAAISGGRKLIVDQFIYFDDILSPSANSFPNAGDLPEYIAKAGPSLARHTAGYGLWMFRDYRANVVYNPSFQVGLHGWDIKGTMAIEEGGTLLDSGARLTQRINKLSTLLAGFTVADEATCLVRAKALDTGAQLKLSIGGETISGEEINTRVPALAEYDIKIEAQNGRMLVQNVALFAHTQHSAIMGTDGSRQSLYASFKNLNALLCGVKKKSG
jgi:hypothetical protein